MRGAVPFQLVACSYAISESGCSLRLVRAAACSQACCVASGLCMHLNVLRLAVLLQACACSLMFPDMLCCCRLVHAAVCSWTCCVASGLCIRLSVLRLAVLLQACGKQPNPSAAVEMLQSAGWWRPHEQLGLIKAQRTETFPSPVQVPICLQGLFCLLNCLNERQALRLHGWKGGFCLLNCFDDRQTLLLHGLKRGFCFFSCSNDRQALLLSALRGEFAIAGHIVCRISVSFTTAEALLQQQQRSGVCSSAQDGMCCHAGKNCTATHIFVAALHCPMATLHLLKWCNRLMHIHTCSS